MNLDIKTEEKKQIIDITNELNATLKKQNATKGLCNLFIKHTTAAITTADLDPGTAQDYIKAFEEIVPKLNYNHPHNPAHMPDHILSTMIGTSLTLPISNGQLDLGTWQRVIIIELDGPREREIVLSIFNS